MKTNHSSRGFTLFEIMIAGIVFTILSASLMSFFLQSLRGIYASEQRQNLASRIKNLSTELVVQASRSNQFILYKTATLADFDGPNPAYFNPVPAPGGLDPTNVLGDRQTTATFTAYPGQTFHPAGDFAVFVYYEIPKPILDPNTSLPLAYHRITKLEGYYLAPTTYAGIGSLKKVVINLVGTGGPGPSTASVETILTTYWDTTTSNWKTTIPAYQFVTVTNYMNLVRGLNNPEVVDGALPLGAVTPRLFYMSDARNVIVSGQNYSSNKAMKITNDWMTYTDTFYFNITPRT